MMYTLQCIVQCIALYSVLHCTVYCPVHCTALHCSVYNGHQIQTLDGYTWYDVYLHNRTIHVYRKQVVTPRICGTIWIVRLINNFVISACNFMD